MKPVRASAPGKIILFGEHAVVYGQPALAVPVTQVQAEAWVQPHPSPPSPASRPFPPLSAGEGEGEWGTGGEIWIDAQDLRRRYRLEAARPNDPLAAAVRLVLDRCGGPQAPRAFTVAVRSTIPIASGLGSGAAVSTAIVRALSAFLGQPLTDAEVSAIVFETERWLHGTPSGIDNTVIAYARPVYFVKGRPPEPFSVAAPFRLLIADTGLPSPTRITVGDVRAGWQREPERYNALFEQVGQLARTARGLIEAGQAGALGPLMIQNHDLLRALGVSCQALDALVEAAQSAGALGAKLSGGGRGGNMLALVTDETAAGVEAALLRAGAKRVLGTTVGAEDR